MLGINNKNHSKKRVKLAQSYLYVSNAVISILESKKIKVIGITSSLECEKANSIICENICKNICDKENKVCLIFADLNTDGKDSKIDESINGNLKTIKAVNINKSELEGLIEREKDEFAVVVSFPSPNVFAEALEYAKVCKNVLLVEKYCYSKYGDFENTLDILKQNGISPLGIIAYV